MNDIITISALEKSSKKSFKNPQLAQATDKIRKIYSDAAIYAEQKNREIATILGTIKTGKLYEADGFSSVYDYADQTFGIKKANSYALAAAGEIYNDAKTPDSLKAFTPSKLYEISRADRDSVQKAIDSGKITPATTQSELRNFAKTLTPAKESSSKVVPTFTAMFYGSTAHIPPQFLTDNYTLETWDHNMELEYPDVEIVKLPKGMASPDADKATVNRRLYISGSIVIMAEFRTWKPKVEAPKSSKKVVDLETISLEELEKILADKRSAKEVATQVFGDDIDTSRIDADIKASSDADPAKAIEKVHNAAKADKKAGKSGK